MPRRIYFSCGFDERDLPQIKSHCGFLQGAGCVIEFSPQFAGWSFYRNIEDAIDRCDSFVALVGRDRAVSSWLAHELEYAFALSRARFRPRPRLFGIRIEGFDLPNCSKHISVEWLDGSAESNELLLQDLPERV